MQPGLGVENNRCGGNDLEWGFCAAGWNGPSKDIELVLSGEEEPKCFIRVDRKSLGR